MITTAKPKTTLDTLYPLIREFSGELQALDEEVSTQIQEIRIRASKPITLELGGRRIWLNPVFNESYLSELIARFCEYSVYSKAKQLSEGFVTIGGGHRVGFCGTAFLAPDGNVSSIRGVTSINIRIARAIIGAADHLYNQIGDEFNGLLILGPPMSAKTTVLRDYVRQLSQTRKVCVIDERGEIAAKHNNKVTHDLGGNTDVLDGFPKEAGFSVAIRAMSPDYIACDEIGNDVSAAIKTAGTGVGLLLTAHCRSLEEAKKSADLQKLMNSGRIDKVAVLGTGSSIGKVLKVYDI